MITNKKFAQEIGIYTVITIVSIFCVLIIKNRYSVLDGSPKSKFALRQESFVKNEELIRQAKLSRSFTEMMELADEHEEEQVRFAIKRYFDAKSIFPYRIEPRLALAKSYITLAKEKPGYRKLAEKEILFAWKYVPETEYNKYSTILTELEYEVSSL